MTAGLWHQTVDALGEGSSKSGPAVSVVWRLSPEGRSSEAWLDLYEGPAGRSAVVALVGALGARPLERLEQALGQILGWGVRQLVLDFSRVTHLDYRRLPAMVTLLRGQAEQGVGFAFVGLNRYLVDLFRVAGVEVELAPPIGVAAECGAAAVPGAPSWEGVPGGALGVVSRSAPRARE